MHNAVKITKYCNYSAESCIETVIIIFAFNTIKAIKSIWPKSVDRNEELCFLQNMSALWRDIV